MRALYAVCCYLMCKCIVVLGSAWRRGADIRCGATLGTGSTMRLGLALGHIAAMNRGPEAH